MAARKGSGFPFPAQPDPSRIPAKELRKIHQRIQKRHKRLRERYKEIRGKRVDWIEHFCVEGDLLVGIQFQDKTYFSLLFTTCIEPRFIQLSDVSSGDDVILKRYFRKRGSTATPGCAPIFVADGNRTGKSACATKPICKGD